MKAIIPQAAPKKTPEERAAERALLKKCGNDKAMLPVIRKAKEAFPIETEGADYFSWFPGFPNEIILAYKQGYTDDEGKEREYLEYKIFNPVSVTMVEGFQLNPRLMLEREYYAKELTYRLNMMFDILVAINKKKDKILNEAAIDKMAAFKAGTFTTYLKGEKVPTLYNMYALACTFGCRLDILAGPYQYIHFTPKVKEENDDKADPAKPETTTDDK